MRTTLIRILAVAIGILSFAPLSAMAQVTNVGYQFKSQGIFGCNQTGSYAMSVGSLTAVGGVYVPVNDAAVTLNTGYLVYKECVLRNVINRMKESVTSADAKQAIDAALTGRNGSPMFSVNIDQEILKTSDKSMLNTLNSLGTNINPAYSSQIKQGLAKVYIDSTRNQLNALQCSETRDLRQVYSRDNSDIWGALADMSDSGCDPVFAYMTADELASNERSNAIGNVMQQLNWGNGYYPNATENPDGTLTIQTPSNLVEQNVTQAVQAGFEEAKAANDIGQLVGSLFSGMASQVVSSSQGLSGLNQSYSGQPSYLDQVASQSAAGLQGAAVNAALQILSSALQIEQAYYKVVNDLGNLLLQTMQQVQGQESRCWTLIIQNVCTGTATSTTLAPGTCIDAQGHTLHIATSTTYSQQVINAQIAPLASSTATSIQASQSAIQAITQLINGVTNSSSPSAQSAALQQLDTLVAQKALHAQQDLTNVQSQSQAVQTTMSNLVQTTAQTWGDGTPNPSNPSDVNSGWCNINNQTTIQMWDQIWR